jgi:Lar family restriction alleviation protein
MSNNCLLPCPFCGGEAKIRSDSTSSYCGGDYHEWTEVVCMGCEALVRMGEIDEATAIAVWNTRTSENREQPCL